MSKATANLGPVVFACQRIPANRLRAPRDFHPFIRMLARLCYYIGLIFTLVPCMLIALFINVPLLLLFNPQPEKMTVLVLLGCSTVAVYLAVLWLEFNWWRRNQFALHAHGLRLCYPKHKLQLPFTAIQGIALHSVLQTIPNGLSVLGERYAPEMATIRRWDPSVSITMVLRDGTIHHLHFLAHYFEGDDLQTFFQKLATLQHEWCAGSPAGATDTPVTKSPDSIQADGVRLIPSSEHVKILHENAVSVTCQKSSKLEQAGQSATTQPQARNDTCTTSWSISKELLLQADSYRYGLIVTVGPVLMFSILASISPLLRVFSGEASNVRFQQTWLPWTGCVLFLFISCTLILYLLRRKAIRRTFALLGESQLRVNLTCSAEGLHFASPAAQWDIHWGLLRKIEMYPKLWLFYRDQEPYIVPATALHEELAALIVKSARSKDIPIHRGWLLFLRNVFRRQ